MDNFGVPKKINRHVLKAVYFLNSKGNKKPTHKEIIKVVQATVKDKSLNDLPQLVQMSLKNMVRLGVIRKAETFFTLYSNKVTASKEDETTKVNPNSRKRNISASSSEEGIEKSRKRFNSNRPLNRKGQTVALPKARRSQSFLNKPTDDSSSGSKNERRRNSTKDKTLRMEYQPETSNQIVSSGKKSSSQMKHLHVSMRDIATEMDHPSVLKSSENIRFQYDDEDIVMDDGTIASKPVQNNNSSRSTCSPNTNLEEASESNNSNGVRNISEPLPVDPEKTSGILPSGGEHVRTSSGNGKQILEETERRRNPTKDKTLRKEYQPETSNQIVSSGKKSSSQMKHSGASMRDIATEMDHPSVLKSSENIRFQYDDEDIVMDDGTNAPEPVQNNNSSRSTCSPNTNLEEASESNNSKGVGNTPEPLSVDPEKTSGILSSGGEHVRTSSGNGKQIHEETEPDKTSLTSIHLIYESKTFTRESGTAEESKEEQMQSMNASPKANEISEQ